MTPAQEQARAIRALFRAGVSAGRFNRRLLDEEDGAWSMTGVDPDGIDMRDGNKRARLDFETPVASASALRQTLADLARKTPE